MDEEERERERERREKERKMLSSRECLPYASGVNRRLRQAFVGQFSWLALREIQGPLGTIQTPKSPRIGPEWFEKL